MVCGVYNAVSLVEERRTIKMKYQDVNKPKEIKVGQLRVWHIVSNFIDIYYFAYFQ